MWQDYKIACEYASPSVGILKSSIGSGDSERSAAEAWEESLGLVARLADCLSIR